MSGRTHDPSPVQSGAATRNAAVWRTLYDRGGGDLRYPSEVFVRLAARLMPAEKPLDVLDFGCGTGANLAHLAAMGHRVEGVDLAPSAVARARERLTAAGLQAGVRAVEPGARLPWEAQTFDAVVAWQVLYYNDHAGWSGAVHELERVLRPGGLLLVATAAPGDVSQLQAEAMGDGLYRSRVPGQEGCTLLIPDREALVRLFPGRALETGEFAFSFGPVRVRHWVVTYRMPS